MHQYIIDNELYLNFMEIEPENIPIIENEIDKKNFLKIVEKQFRTLARKHHPDYGGTEDNFKFLIICKSKLCEENNDEGQVSLFFDASKFKSYDKSSLASSIGNQIFELISEWSNDIGVIPIFKPTSSNDEYEWVFNIVDTNEQLSLNVQNLSNELAEISHDMYKDDSLSVLVCLFVPSKKMVKTIFEYDNSTLLTFDDKILIESCNSKDIAEYFENKEKILNDLIEIKAKNFVSKNNSVIKTKKTNEIKEKDKKIIEYIHNFKIFNTEYNENAADFLDKL